MVSLESIKRDDLELLVKVRQAKSKLSSALSAQVRAHIQKVRDSLSERINELSDMADSSSEWSKSGRVRALQSERKVLVDMLESWSSLGF